MRPVLSYTVVERRGEERSAALAVLGPSPLILSRLIINSNNARLHLQFKVCSVLTSSLRNK